MRRIEAASRDVLVGLAARRKRPPPLEFGDGAAPVRALYLRYDRIGDMILSTGLLRAIAKAQPNVRVDVLASPENTPVLEGNPYVGDIIVADRRRPVTYASAFRRIRARRYDAILDCQIFSPSTTSLVMMLASGARHRIGLAGRGIDSALTLPVERPPSARHYVEHLGALAAPFGVVNADWRPDIYLTAAERSAAEARWRPGRRLLVNISAGKPSRRWPEDRFATILRALRARARALNDLDVIVTAAPADADTAQRISAAGGAWARFERTRSVREAFALVATADYVLTPDTAITHAASAFAKPAVVLFPRNRAEVWVPYQTGGTFVETTEGTIRSLPVEPVLDALTGLLLLEPVSHPT
jgi:ADP-heptose:LPS heptosyltransferase